MGHRIFVGGLFLFVAGVLPFGDTVVAAQKDAAPGATQNPAQGQASNPPQYDPTADSIVTGLKGVATGAQAAFGSYNDTARTTQVQNALVKAIDAAADKSKVRLDLGNVAILCDVRESYAQAKAYTDGVNAVTGALDTVATPATVGSLGDAFGDLFKKYSFTVKDNSTPATPGATRDACIADLQAWAHYYYNGKDTPAQAKAAALAASTTTPAPAGIDAFFGDLSAVSGIVGAIVNIITPIVTYAAQKKDQAERQAFIDNYLHDPGGKSNKTIEAILKEARSLAAATNNLAVQARYVALGQFVEKMAALRETPIDLTKVKSNDERCDTAVTKYAGESEKLGLKTTAETAPSNAILHFAAVPPWIKPGINIYLENGASPDAVVKSLQGPASVTMTITAPKGGIAKGTAITFTAPDLKVGGATLPGEKVTLDTSAATPATEKTLHFETLPEWVARGVKITAAKPALNTGVDAVTFTAIEMDKSATGSGVGAAANVQFTFPTASEGYVSCFAQASKQINQAVSDVVKAAANYDTAALAQTSSDGLSSQLDKITAATETPNPPWPASKNSPAAQDAAELAAFGDAMQKAFSQSNINALQSALDAAQKQFDIK